MNYENLNITQEEFENNTNLHINIVDLDAEQLFKMCLHEKGVDLTDNISKADYTLENPSSADGYDLFYFGDTRYEYDFYENVFVNEDSAVERVWETLSDEDNFTLYMDLDIDVLIDNYEDEIYALAESVGLIMRDDVSEFGDIDNPTYDEWVWVEQYNEREDELESLLEELESIRELENKAVDNAVDRIMEGNIDSDKE